MILRYATAEYRESQKNDIYKVYVTDCLKIIAENISKIGGGSTMKSRYSEIIQPVGNENTTETADEIIQRMKTKLKAMGGITD